MALLGCWLVSLHFLCDILRIVAAGEWKHDTIFWMERLDCCFRIGSVGRLFLLPFSGNGFPVPTKATGNWIAAYEKHDREVPSLASCHVSLIFISSYVEYFKSSERVTIYIKSKVINPSLDRRWIIENISMKYFRTSGRRWLSRGNSIKEMGAFP